MQSKRQSLIESCVNVVIGYIVAVLSQLAIYPLFDVNLSLGDNLVMGLYFTLVSLIRGYLFVGGLIIRALDRCDTIYLYFNLRNWNARFKRYSKQD